jgi:hypothetical protein
MLAVFGTPNAMSQLVAAVIWMGGNQVLIMGVMMGRRSTYVLRTPRGQADTQASDRGPSSFPLAPMP